MSNKTLGIDLGTNSIGWAIRQENNKLSNQIIDKGVLLFDKGVASEKGNEFPKVQKRTESRGKRRNYQAEKYRKYSLLEFLINKNMCPLTIEELDKWRKYTKGQKRLYPQTDAFLNWLRFDFDGDGKPDFHLFNKSKHESYYVFRAEAINANVLEVFNSNPHILGRVLYQLVQRRGFKGRDEEEAKTMLKGSQKAGTPGRDSIEEYIVEHKTLGAALYHYQKEKGGRIRKRYNLRRDYENELRKICSVHGIDERDYKKLWKSIIWQRPLRTQKGLIGLCTYEKNKRRIKVSHPLYQEYKTWVFINNLKISPPEGQELRKYLNSRIYPLFIRKSDFEVRQIIDRVLADGGKVNSNFNSKKLLSTKVVALSNFYDFSILFGDDWKESMGLFKDIRDAQQLKKQESGYSIEDVWHILTTFDSKEKLIEFGSERLILDESGAKRFSEIRLANGYATLSLSAVKKILPFLQQGIKYSTAVYLASMHKVLGVEINKQLIKYFVEEVEKVGKEVERKKLLNHIVNSLIKSHLEEEDRYFIEDNRALDQAELQLIEDLCKRQFGNSSWEELPQQEKDTTLSYVQYHFRDFLTKRITDKKDLFLKIPRFHQELFNSLQEKFDLPDGNIKYLWHPSEQEKYHGAKYYHKYLLKGESTFIEENSVTGFETKHPSAIDQNFSLKLLGSPEPISKGFKNPMALKSLHKLKHLVNHLLKTEQIDEDTRIVIEIARELNDNNKRAAIRSYQRAREKKNNEISARIEEYNKETGNSYNPKDDVLIKRFRLWEEQKQKCLYTGKTITVSEVFKGNEFELEHTIPESLSFDSRLENLTLAEKSINDFKGKRIPSQLHDLYDGILKNVSFMKDEIARLEFEIRKNVNAVRGVADKAQKDALIQKRHLLKFDLKYWRHKYWTFTIKEYKLKWKNSQLKDTQIMTKYALPYLKTVFKKVSVEKGETVSKFKKIYKVELDEKKDRTDHAHHAKDAAILTLIPSSYYREKLLEQYYIYRENKQRFHSIPSGWSTFSAKHIIDIQDSVLANKIVDERKFVSTYKKARIRGKVKLNKDGSVRWNKGDSIRGQLHSESFYGTIKEAVRNERNKISFDDNKHMVLSEMPRIVKRRDLIFRGTNDTAGFRSLEELEKVIVDKDLYKQIELQVGNKSFKEAVERGFYMFDKKGVKVNKIRRVRCFETQLKYSTAIQVHQHSFKSKHSYKQTTYSKNEENAYCLFYRGQIGNKEEKGIKIISLFEFAQSKIQNEKQFYNTPYFNKLKLKNGDVELIKVLKTGDRFIFYTQSIEELKDLNEKEILQRLYVAYQFENDGRIKLKHHLLAGELTEAKKKFKEASAPSFNVYTPLLRIRKAQWNFAIEDVDFKISIDGKIIWLNNLLR